VVTNKDIVCPFGFEIVNKDQYICTLSPDTRLKMKILIREGRGYVRAEDNRSENASMSRIYLDSLFSPVVRAVFKVEGMRVGNDSNYEKLTLEVETDGSITPNQAISLASNILKSHLSLYDELDAIEAAKQVMTNEIPNSVDGRHISFSVAELGLSARSLNALKRSGIETVDRLTKMTEDEVQKINNLGRKSVQEINQALQARGYKLIELSGRARSK
jgi:DNA-directed RNA polymerase subunit alpha